MVAYKPIKNKPNKPNKPKTIKKTRRFKKRKSKKNKKTESIPKFDKKKEEDKDKGPVDEKGNPFPIENPEGGDPICPAGYKIDYDFDPFNDPINPLFRCIPALKDPNDGKPDDKDENKNNDEGKGDNNNNNKSNELQTDDDTTGGGRGRGRGRRTTIRNIKYKRNPYTTSVRYHRRHRRHNNTSG